MNSHIRRAPFIPMLVGLVFFTLWLPVAPAQAQCTSNDLTAPVFCSTTMMVTMTRMYCFKNLRYNMAGMTPTLPTTRMCMPYPTMLMSPTDSTNLTACSYIMGQRRLYGRRNAPVTMAFCQVTCDCGLLRIDETEGLPIELLEFSIEDNDTEGQE